MTDTDLDAIAGGPVRLVTVAGRDVQVSPLKIRELAPVARALEPVAPQLQRLLDGELTAARILAFAIDADQFADAVAAAARLDRQWVGDLLGDDFVVLARAVIEVNLDFFVQRVVPALQAGGTSATS